MKVFYFHTDVGYITSYLLNLNINRFVLLDQIFDDSVSVVVSLLMDNLTDID